MSAPDESSLEVPPPRALSAGGLLSLLVYQCAFLLFALLYSPVLLWRLAFDQRYRRGLSERLGLSPKTSDGRPVVWVHAVSVGELKAAGQLIEGLVTQHSDHEVVISCTTPTGRALARQVHPSLRSMYYPLDFGPFPWLAIRRVRPAVVLLVELEYWPNFLFCAARRRVPVAVVNGRISERSFRGYRRIRGLSPPFGAISRFCMQDESYRKRLSMLGVPAARIFVTGNMKYDAVRVGRTPARAQALANWLRADGSAVVVCGSTHGDEEAMLLDALADARARLARPIRVVLAPRHPERAHAVSEVIAQHGLRALAWSTCASLPVLGPSDAVLVDTIGHLEAFYAAADVAFVGGSLVPRGGQNMLEPAALGRAVVFGPHTSNFRNDVELLLGAGAAIQVGAASDLGRTFCDLLQDPRRREDLGARAVSLIQRNQGATARTMGLVAPLLATRRRSGGTREGGPGASASPTSVPAGTRQNEP
ncbi:MAG: 3-deoxy-D-manno-octulosonic acid transferase [Planctomycetota bacterium]